MRATIWLRQPANSAVKSVILAAGLPLIRRLRLKVKIAARNREPLPRLRATNGGSPGGHATFVPECVVRQSVRARDLARVWGNETLIRSIAGTASGIAPEATLLAAVTVAAIARHGQPGVGAGVLRIAVRAPLAVRSDQRLCRPVPVATRSAPGPRKRRAEMAGPAAFCVRALRRPLLPDPAQWGVTPGADLQLVLPGQPRPRSTTAAASSMRSPPDGKRYAELSTAFVYREKIVPGCTCNGKDAFGLVNTPVRGRPDPARPATSSRPTTA